MVNPKSQQKIIFIVGPTAVGKSAIAYALAQKINGEIISCDSMQIYKEIDIASNKPTDAERKNVPHWMLDVASVENEFNVAAYSKMALSCIEDILQRQCCPIVVGGSGLYIQALLDGLFEGLPKDDKLRQQLSDEAEEHGSAFLHQRLMGLDPVAAQKIHANDQRRIIRALEVCLTEKKPISQLQPQREGLWGRYDVRLFGLTKDRDQLYEVINQRVDVMIQNGLLEEIGCLKNKSLSLTSKKLIGVQEMLSYLKGDLDKEDAIELMKKNTRNFAKRQMTWFRKDQRCHWVDWSDGQTVDHIVESILRSVSQNSNKGHE